MPCVKCGFTPDPNTFYPKAIEYKDKCYTTKCGWEDSDVDEHLHVTCPGCGYTTALPCDDYQTRKAQAMVDAANRQSYVQPRSYQPSLYPVSRVSQAWDAEG